MTWPRGRYNGKRIIGGSVKVVVDVTCWRWRPNYIAFAGGLHWLCFRTFWHAEYDHKSPPLY